MATALESEFHEAMLGIYMRAKAEAGYNATRFLGMVSEHGGLETARILLHAATVSDGYTALWERGRLDLTVEAVILQAKWKSLFTKAERQTAIRRLREYEFSGPLPDPTTTANPGFAPGQAIPPMTRENFLPPSLSS
jgi:hypothetical protein